MTPEVTSWSPLHATDANQLECGKYGLLVLNQLINLRPAFMNNLWNRASIRSTVDGGTDRWFEYCKKQGMPLLFPNIVSGDFDSIKPDTLSACRAQKGVRVVETPDQNFTDFQKSLVIMSETYKDHLDSVVAVCETSGRIDQIYSNMNTLGTVHKYFPNLPRLYFLASDSLTWYLKSGVHRISLPKYIRNGSPWCALLPYENDGTVTTGLKWNLDDQCVRFGGLISSSNTYDGSPEVTVTARGGLIWSMGLVDN